MSSCENTDEMMMSDTETSQMNLLIARVDRIEEEAHRVHRLEQVIEDLQVRLHKAELRISPYGGKPIPWRRIGGSKTTETAVGAEESAAVDKVEDGGGGTGERQFRDRDIKPDEEYQLPMDIYTVVTAWRWNSRPYWVALCVIAVQILLLTLLLIDQIGSAGASDLVVFPPNVPSSKNLVLFCPIFSCFFCCCCDNLTLVHVAIYLLKL